MYTPIKFILIYCIQIYFITFPKTCVECFFCLFPAVATIHIAFVVTLAPNEIEFWKFPHLRHK